MAGMGTGAPLYFICAALRRVYYKVRHEYHKDHDGVPTGKTKKFHPAENQTHHIRMVKVYMEYVCKCGHRGWTRHLDMAVRYKRAFGEEPEHNSLSA